MSTDRQIIKNGPGFLVFFLILFGWSQAFSQGPAKHNQDTIVLLPFQYTRLNTNNGTSCVYCIRNSSVSNIATAVTAGAPDSLRFDNDSLFNGIHNLMPGQQLIVVGNFQGKQISTINLSTKTTPITTMLYCPGQ